VTHAQSIPNSAKRAARPAFTLVEAVLAMLVVALMLVAALNAVSAARAAELAFADRTRGAMLAQALLDEVLSRAYDDPEESDAPLGPDDGETTRAKFNDVDDYANWTESPPQNLDGTSMTDLAGWTRSVVVERVDGANPSGPAAGAETGLKRVTVTVRRGARTVAQLTALAAN